MKNKIIRKDIRSNFLVYLLATIAIIVLTIIEIEVFNVFPEDIGIFISVLSGILSGLLSLSLLVYVLINNFYSDKRQNLLSEVRSLRKYLYYRISYAYLSLFYFIIIPLIITILFTDARLQDLIAAINIYTFIIVINIALLYFCFLMLAFFKTMYNFKLPIRVLVFAILLVLSLLVTLYNSINGAFAVIIFFTILSMIISVLLIAAINSTATNYAKKSIIIDAILVIIVIIIGLIFVAIYNINEYNYADSAYSEEEGYYSEEDGYYSEEDGGKFYNDEITMSYDKLYEGTSDLGTITVFMYNVDYYNVYIDGEYEVEATYSTYTTDTSQAMYTITATNYATGENIFVQGSPGELSDYYLDYSSYSLEGDVMTNCNASYTVDSESSVFNYSDVACADSEQLTLVNQINTEVLDILSSINEQ